MFTFDTNAIIYYIKGDAETVQSLQNILLRESLRYISSITIVELLGFSKLSLEEERAIENILRTLTAVSVDPNIARRAAILRRELNLGVSDSVIAATALFTGSTLVTRNIKDFKKVPNLKLLKI